ASSSTPPGIRGRLVGKAVPQSRDSRAFPFTPRGAPSLHELERDTKCKIHSFSVRAVAVLSIFLFL
ncbi:TPA: hypothetical protein DCL30_05145, partial [Candidatus Peribacteria bacterium]|nr:hypothetical protein [Candidatus Peribacteria bacterium]